MFFKRDKNRKASKIHKDAERANSEMERRVNIKQYSRNISQSVALSARDAFLDLNPTIKEINDASSSFVGTLRSKYKHNKEIQESEGRVRQTGMGAIKTLSKSLREAIKETQNGGFDLGDELEEAGISLDASKFSLDSNEEDSFENEDGSLQVNTKTIVLKSNNKSTAALATTITTSFMSLIRVNQSGFQSVLTGIGEVAQNNVTFYNQMITSLTDMNKQLMALNRASKIDSVSGLASNSALDELVMGNFSINNVFRAFKERNERTINDKGGGGMLSGIAMGVASNMLSDNIKSGKLFSAIKSAKNFSSDFAFNMYDHLDTGGFGNSKVIGKFDEWKKNSNSKIAKFLPTLGGDKGLLTKGSKSLRKLIFGDLDDSVKGYDIRNKLDKGTAVAFDAETHNSINVVIPGYLGKILAHFTGTEIVNDYKTGKWITVDQAKDKYNSMVKNAVKGNDQVQDLGQRIFGGKVPSSYGDLMTELAQNRDLKPEDIKNLSEKYGEAAYTLYNAIIGDESTFKDFKLARNSASREIFTINKNKEFSGSMLNAFNDKIDFINDTHVEMAKNRAEAISKITDIVGSINSRLKGTDEDAEVSSDDANGNDGEEKSTAEAINENIDNFKEKFLSSDNPRVKKLRDKLDSVQGKFNSAKDKVNKKFEKITSKVPGKLKGKVDKEISKTEAKPSSDTTKDKKTGKMANSTSKLKGLVGRIKGQGKGGNSGIIDGSMTGLAGVGSLMAMIGIAPGGEETSGKKSLNPIEQIEGLPNVLETLSGDGNSKSKIKKLMDKFPLARSISEFVNDTQDKGWMAKGKSLISKLTPIADEGYQQYGMLSQILAGNPLGGVAGYGLGKIGEKIGNKHLGKFGSLAGMAGTTIGSMVFTRLGRGLGSLIGNPFSGGEAKAAGLEEQASTNVLGGPMGGNYMEGQFANDPSGVMTTNNPMGMSIANGQNPMDVASRFQNQSGLSNPLGTGMTSSTSSPHNGGLLKDMGVSSSEIKDLKSTIDSNSDFGGDNSNSPSATKFGTGITRVGAGGSLAMMSSDSMDKLTDEENGLVNKGNDVSSALGTGKLTTASAENSEEGMAGKLLGGLGGMQDAMSKMMKNNPIIGQMINKPKELASKLLSFTPMGAVLQMTGNNFDPSKPSGSVTGAIERYFDELKEKVQTLIEIAESAGEGDGEGEDGDFEDDGDDSWLDDGEGGGSAGGGGGMSSAVISFIKKRINHDFNVNVDKMAKDFANRSQKAKARLGGSPENVKRLIKTIREEGVSPEWFLAYEINEQNAHMGWLNHWAHPQSSDPYEDARIVCRWIKQTASGSGKVQLAWYDASFPNKYHTPKEKQAKGQKIADSLPSGTIGRVYLAGTAAATWEAFDPAALKGSVNGVQDYGTPMKHCIQTLKSWGAKGGGGGSKRDTPAFDKTKTRMVEENEYGQTVMSEKVDTNASTSTGGSSDSDSEEEFEDAPIKKERSKSLAKWDDEMHLRIIETMAKKYTMMYDNTNKEMARQNAEAAARNSNSLSGLANRLSGGYSTDGIIGGEIPGGSSSASSSYISGGNNLSGNSSATSSNKPTDPHKISYVDENGNVIVTGDPTAIATAQQKIKVDSDILDILKKIYKATKDISGHTKEALIKLIAMLKEIEGQTTLTEENNDISELTNILLKRLSFEGGLYNPMTGLAKDPLDFELESGLLIPILQGN